MSTNNIKFCSYKNIVKYKGYILCQEVYIDNYTFSIGYVIDNEFIEVINKFKELDYYILISKEHLFDIDEMKSFLIDTFNLYLEKEIEYIQHNFTIKEKNFERIVIDFFSRIIVILNLDYILMLLNNGIVREKMLRQSILSFYFAIKNELTIREIEDITIASMLSNLNTSLFYNIKDISNEDYLLRYKKNIKIDTSYNIIKDDKFISTNVKRLVMNFNKLDNTSYSIYKDKAGKEYVRDISLEIIQISNDLLTYPDKHKRKYISRRLFK